MNNFAFNIISENFVKINDCHLPAGPGGGQFCSEGGGSSSLGISTEGKKSIKEMLPLIKMEHRRDYAKRFAEYDKKSPDEIIKTLEKNFKDGYFLNFKETALRGWLKSCSNPGGVALKQIANMVETTNNRIKPDLNGYHEDILEHNLDSAYNSNGSYAQHKPSVDDAVDSYLELRAATQAYLNKTNSEGSLELKRGIDGKHGKQYEELCRQNLSDKRDSQFVTPKEGVKLPLEEDSIVSYTDNFSTAIKFGNFVVQRSVPNKDIFLTPPIMRAAYGRGEFDEQEHWVVNRQDKTVLDNKNLFVTNKGIDYGGSMTPKDKLDSWEEKQKELVDIASYHGVVLASFPDTLMFVGVDDKNHLVGPNLTPELHTLKDSVLATEPYGYKTTLFGVPTKELTQMKEGQDKETKDLLDGVIAAKENYAKSSLVSDAHGNLYLQQGFMDLITSTTSPLGALGSTPHLTTVLQYVSEKHPDKLKNIMDQVEQAKGLATTKGTKAKEKLDSKLSEMLDLPLVKDLPNKEKPHPDIQKLSGKLKSYIAWTTKGYAQPEAGAYETLGAAEYKKLEEATKKHNESINKAMGIIKVEGSNLVILKSNDCHLPSGPGGGQYCSTSGVPPRPKSKSGKLLARKNMSPEQKLQDDVFRDYLRKLILENYNSGMSRQAAIHKKLTELFPASEGFKILSECYTCDNLGQHIYDEKTNERRRIDLIVVKGDAVVKAVEVTSKKAGKKAQMGKENRIRTVRKDGKLKTYVQKGKDVFLLPYSVKTRVWRTEDFALTHEEVTKSDSWVSLS